ncbi:MAG: tetratricopeptide repeat protein [Cyanobacteria bacterium TGS_CYA1]|nr:tetratricopeptide repeat protein [Cyanobacteria bacterium TGS_CYA1]
MNLSNVIKVVPTLLTLILSTPALANAEQGIAEFNKKNYKAALVHFNEHLRANPSDLNSAYYAGICYQMTGNTSEALKFYKRVLEIDPKSRHAAAVSPFLARYGIKSGATSSTTGTSTAKTLDPKNPFDAIELVRSLPLEKRIIIVAPKFNHPAVSSTTVRTVEDVLKRLPDHLYRTLDEGKATITIAPNLIDKWPGTSDGNKPKIFNVTMGEEGARAYDADIHIYEREAIRNSTQLKEMRSQAEIRNNLLWVIAHALDHIMGNYTTSAKFVEAHKLDLERSDIRSINPYMAYDSTEASAGIAAYLLGSTDEHVLQAVVNFHRLKPLVKAKLKL